MSIFPEATNRIALGQVSLYLKKETRNERKSDEIRTLNLGKGGGKPGTGNQSPRLT